MRVIPFLCHAPSVLDLSSTLSSHSSFVSPIFYFILLIFHFFFYVDRFGVNPLCASANEESGLLVNNAPITQRAPVLLNQESGGTGGIISVVLCAILRQMPTSFLFLQKDLEQDNGHLLVLVLKRSDILSVKIVQKEYGTIWLKRCCWNSQKVDVQCSALRAHCPEVDSKAKDMENCLYTMQPIWKRLKLFFA